MMAHHNKGEFIKAATIGKKALTVAEKTFGPDDQNVASSLATLSVLYFVLKRNDEAEAAIKRALAIQEKALAKNYQAVLSSIKILGVVYMMQNRLDEAEPLLKKAVKLAEQQNGPGHPETAKHLGNLGAFYMESDSSQAKTLLERSMAIWDKHGPNVHYTVTVMTNLARLRIQEKNHSAAKGLFERALKLTEKSFPENHPKIAEVLDHYADFLAKSGDEQRVRTMRERADSIKGAK